MKNIIRSLAISLLLLAPNAHAAIAFVSASSPGQWSGAANPQTSGSFTPSSGETFLLAASDIQGGSSGAFSGTGSYSDLNPPGSIGDPNQSDRWDTGVNLSATASSQTITYTSNGSAGDIVLAFSIRYSGVGSVTGETATFAAAPGTGAGAITGTPVTVASGSVLVALCVSYNSPQTVTNTSGTSRANGTNNSAYRWVEYAGSGSSITPAFTAVTGTGNFIVMEFLLAPSGGGITHGVLTSGGSGLPVISGTHPVYNLRPANDDYLLDFFKDAI